MEVQRYHSEHIPPTIDILAQENAASIRCTACDWKELCKLTDAMSLDKRNAAIERALYHAAIRRCGHWKVSGRGVQDVRDWLRRTTANPST